MNQHQERAFGIKYKYNDYKLSYSRKTVKYFDANQEQLVKFRASIACLISFNTLDDHYKIDELVGKGSFSSVLFNFQLGV